MMSGIGKLRRTSIGIAATPITWRCSGARSKHSEPKGCLAPRRFLNDLGPFYEWVAREDPPYSKLVAIKAWVDGLPAVPWNALSAPIPEMSVEGENQVRTATVLGVEIIYEETYETGAIDLLDVRAISE